MATTFQPKSAQAVLSARTTTALRIVVALSLAAACIMALAETESALQPAIEPSDADLAQVERAFWACDHAASSYGLLGTDVAACNSATEQLKQLKFGGDFDALLAWWRAGKGAAFDALDRDGSANAVAEAYPQP